MQTTSTGLLWLCVCVCVYLARSSMSKLSLHLYLLIVRALCCCCRCVYSASMLGCRLSAHLVARRVGNIHMLITDHVLSSWTFWVGPLLISWWRPLWFPINQAFLIACVLYHLCTGSCNMCVETCHVLKLHFCFSSFSACVSFHTRSAS